MKILKLDNGAIITEVASGGITEISELMKPPIAWRFTVYWLNESPRLYNFESKESAQKNHEKLLAFLESLD